MSAFSPENMERMGKWMQGAGKGMRHAKDAAENAVEKARPHVQRGKEKFEEAVFGDKESGKPGVMEQLRELGRRMREGYKPTAEKDAGVFSLKPTQHPNLTDLEYTVFDAVAVLNSEKKAEAGKASKIQYSPIKPGEICAYIGQDESAVSKALFKLDSLGLVSLKTVPSEASIPAVASLRLSSTGSAVHTRCNTPKSETPSSSDKKE